MPLEKNLCSLSRYVALHDRNGGERPDEFIWYQKTWTPVNSNLYSYVAYHAMKLQRPPSPGAPVLFLREPKKSSYPTFLTRFSTFSSTLVVCLDGNTITLEQKLRSACGFHVI